MTVDADCTEDLCRARTGLPVTFVDTSSGNVRQRLWEFDHDASARGPTAAYAWREPGFYDRNVWVFAASREARTSTAAPVVIESP